MDEKQRDLLDQLIAAPLTRRRKPKYPAAKRRGYAYHPGTGPDGETCGSCKHIVRTRRYRKCRKAEQIWTHGQGSDVAARSPACKYWEKPDPETNQ